MSNDLKGVNTIICIPRVSDVVRIFRFRHNLILWRLEV
jgi:hypothetical protein